jgi:hypothetical protein
MKIPVAEKRLDRRHFLVMGGVSSAAIVAAVSPALSTKAQAMNPGSEETKARYRESEHVKAFYRVNRY